MKWAVAVALALGSSCGAASHDDELRISGSEPGGASGEQRSAEGSASSPSSLPVRITGGAPDAPGLPVRIPATDAPASDAPSATREAAEGSPVEPPPVEPPSFE